MGLIGKLVKKVLDSPDRLGRQGERRVSGSLSWANFWGYRGMQLRNVYIPRKNGGTSEIDLLYIAAKGIFVIESKNYAGYIYGKEENTYWTRTLYRGRDQWGRPRLERDRFYNPIWQNRAHIRFLRQYLGEDIPMISVIVFSDHCELKDVEWETDEVTVCCQDELHTVISRLWRRYRSVLREEQIRTLYQELLPLTQCSRREKRDHVKQVREKLQDLEFCPLCGGRMVLRTVRSGPNAGRQFYGCSNFPRCRFTRNL